MSEMINTLQQPFLVIDDDDFQVNLVALHLRNIGCVDIRTFLDPIAAFAHIEAEKFSTTVIVLDINMPNMDGLQFLAKLKGLDFAGYVILVSGENDQILRSTRQLCQEYKITVLGTIQKPTTQAALEGLLKNTNIPAAQSSDAVDKLIDRLNSLRSTRVLQEPHRRDTNQASYTVDELTRAINAHQLFNLYQPKIRVKDGAVVSVEALVRWAHPLAGTVLPENFIGLAAHSTLIDDIGKQVLEAVIRQITRWDEAGLDFNVGVNIALDNLKSPGFAKYLEQCLDAGKLDDGTLIFANSLTFEVTESRLTQDISQILHWLTRLRLYKIDLSVDNFGTAEPGPTQLTGIPFQEIKVDRSFVHNAWQQADPDGMLATSVSLAHKLGMKVVATGIESIEDWRFVVAAGCDYAQGNYLAEPMTADAISDWQRRVWKQRRPEFGY